MQSQRKGWSVNGHNIRQEKTGEVLAGKNFPHDSGKQKLYSIRLPYGEIGVNPLDGKIWR